MLNALYAMSAKGEGWVNGTLKNIIKNCPNDTLNPAANAYQDRKGGDRFRQRCQHLTNMKEGIFENLAYLKKLKGDVDLNEEDFVKQAHNYFKDSFEHVYIPPEKPMETAGNTNNFLLKDLQNKELLKIVFKALEVLD